MTPVLFSLNYLILLIAIKLLMIKEKGWMVSAASFPGNVATSQKIQVEANLMMPTSYLISDAKKIRASQTGYADD